jgi:hypothetical protein
MYDTWHGKISKPSHEELQDLFNINEQSYDLLTNKGESILSEIIKKDLLSRESLVDYTQKNYMDIIKQYYPDTRE